MKTSFLAIVTILLTTNAFSQECDCSSYPFKPPKCFNPCVKKWAAKPSAEIDGIKNIDPGFSVGLRVLSNSRDRPVVDLSTIQNKKDLDRAALETMRQRVTGSPK